MRRVVVGCQIREIPALKVPPEPDFGVEAFGVFNLGLVLNHPLKIGVEFLHLVSQGCVSCFGFGFGLGLAVSPCYGFGVCLLLGRVK